MDSERRGRSYVREIAGAIERPAGSRIEIEASGDGTWLRIPRQRMPWLVYLGAAVACLSLLSVVIAGAMVFVFRIPFPGYEQIIGGRLGPQPISWRFAGLFGWLLITPALGALLATSLRPLFRREAIYIPSRASAMEPPSFVMLRHQNLGLQHEARIELADILRFELHRDPQELMESEIVIETRSALAQGRYARRRTVGDFTSEAEREWLASVLNALLSEARKG